MKVKWIQALGIIQQYLVGVIKEVEVEADQDEDEVVVDVGNFVEQLFCF